MMEDPFPGLRVGETIRGSEPQIGDPGYRTWSNLHERVQSCAWKTVEGCIARLSAVGNEKGVTLKSVMPELQALFQAHCKELEAYKEGKTTRRAIAFGRYMRIHLNEQHTGISFTLIYEPHYERVKHDDLVESVWDESLQIILECVVELERTSRGRSFAEAEGEIAITITQKSCSVHSNSTTHLVTTEGLTPSGLLTMNMAPSSTCDSCVTA